MSVKQTAPFMLAAAHTARGQSKAPQRQTTVPTVEELAADPDRLKKLQRQCRTERANQGALQCSSANQQRACGFPRPDAHHPFCVHAAILPVAARASFTDTLGRAAPRTSQTCFTILASKASMICCGTTVYVSRSEAS